jgi:ribonucleotide reductase alpha subunit
MSYVKRYYDAISKHKINIPTPILAGVRTKLRQYSSCVLVDVGDSLSSIEASDAAVFRYVAQRAGLGINAGRIRGINSKIRGGEVVHTGVIPYLKKFEATVKSCTQNGIRGGCFDSDSEVLLIDSVEIDGKIYTLDDEIDGVKVSEIINSHNGNKTVMLLE